MGLALFAGCGGQKTKKAISGTVSACGSTIITIVETGARKNTKNMKK